MMSYTYNIEAMDDHTLIDQCKKGSSLAQKTLFEKYAPKLMFLCLRYCKERKDAEDVLQEGFIKIFSNLDKYEFNGSFEGWLRKIVVNCALDYLRKDKLIPNMNHVDDLSFSLTDNSLASDELNEQDLLNLIHQMPKGYKIIFNLFAIEGYSHKEISELLSISEETSKSQYFRARNYLKKQLESIENEYKR